MRPEDTSAEWWRIDARSGERLRVPAGGDGGPACYLGDGPLDIANVTAIAIEASFNPARYFSDEEVRRLLLGREVPASVRPHGDASLELLELVDGLWCEVDECYRRTWGRPAGPDERRLIVEDVFPILRRPAG